MAEVRKADKSIFFFILYIFQVMLVETVMSIANVTSKIGLSSNNEDRVYYLFSIISSLSTTLMMYGIGRTLQNSLKEQESEIQSLQNYVLQQIESESRVDDNSEE